MKKNFLKKVILVFVGFLVFSVCSLNSKNVNASVTTSYDFIPMGINYLDPKNLEYSLTEDGYIISSKELIMIEAKTAYYFKIFDNLGFFCGGEINIYDEGGNIYLSYDPIEAGNKESICYSGDSDVKYISFSIGIGYYDGSDLSKKCNLIMYDENADIDNATALDVIYQGKDGYVPVEKEYNYYTNASDPITLEKLNEEIKVFDDVDGDISNLKEIVNDTYSNNFGKVGTWVVEYYVEDGGGNPATLTVYVHVADDIAPVIEGPLLLEAPHNNPITEKDVRNELTATDNALGNITSSIEMVSNSYTGNESTVGTYEIVYRVNDGVNITEHTVTIEVFYNDIYKPVFSGNFEIEVGNNTNININQLIAGIKITDDVDTNLIINIPYDDYTDNIGKVGRYKVTLSATDTAGNTATQDVYITIKDKTPPVFMVYSKNIYLNASINAATTADLINYMKKTNNLDTNLNYEVIYDEYSENKNTPGRYRVVFESSGIKTGVMVEVVDRMYEVEEDISFFVRVKTFFKNIFSIIGDFFGSIF